MGLTIDINKLILGSENMYKIFIVPPSTGPFKDYTTYGTRYQGEIITGLLTSGMSFSGSNTWDGLHSGVPSIAASAQKAATIFQTAQETLTNGDHAGQLAVTGITQTIAKYCNSARPSFSFRIMFLNTNKDSDIITPVERLLMGTMPYTAGEDGVWGTLEAPYKYIAGFNINQSGDAEANSKNNQGLWSVKVGHWFECTELIIRDVSVEFSTQCTRLGVPLFAEVQVTFETYRLLAAKEIIKLFKLR